MSDALKVANFTILSTLPNHEKGEVAFCEEEKKYYFYDGEEWKDFNASVVSDGLQLSLYDLNRQIVEQQFPAFGESQWTRAESIFADWEDVKKHNYFMLYGKEVGYFTVFKKKQKNGEFNSLFEALKECLENVGEVHSFDIVDEGAAIEIWVKCNEVMTCMYLFKYDDGVVTFNE